jgi:hypothetical protein
MRRNAAKGEQEVIILAQHRRLQSGGGVVTIAQGSFCPNALQISKGDCAMRT